MDEIYKERLNNYIKLFFSAGIEPYMQSLQKHGIVRKKNILDVGCGPGHWTFAAAKLNPIALVVGIDVNEYFLDFAAKYAKRNKISNCKFFKESYENLLKIFQPRSFDVIMCNNVIQYINEEKAFFIFSRLLRNGGMLIMFYNHGPGYYLHNFLLTVKTFNIKKILSRSRATIKVLMFNNILKYILHTKFGDHSVTLGYLRKISKEVDIILNQIQTEPKLKYKDKFLGITYVFSCKGIKI